MWETIDRPGYFGAKRDAKHLEYDQRFGVGEWRIAWQVGESIVGLDGAVMLYEDAYFEFIRSNPAILAQLLADASDVYDDEPSNTESGFDYFKQETARTHLQDVAIRRVVLRLGERFRGNRLIRIRQELGDHPLSMTLSPGRVPFHRPDLIVQPQLEKWWLPYTVESFYQSNKVLQVQEQPMELYYVDPCLPK